LYTTSLPRRSPCAAALITPSLFARTLRRTWAATAANEILFQESAHRAEGLEGDVALEGVSGLGRREDGKSRVVWLCSPPSLRQFRFPPSNTR
jgi:hypothetical protein